MPPAVTSGPLLQAPPRPSSEHAGGQGAITLPQEGLGRGPEAEDSQGLPGTGRGRGLRPVRGQGGASPVRRAGAVGDGRAAEEGNPPRRVDARQRRAPRTSEGEAGRWRRALPPRPARAHRSASSGTGQRRCPRSGCKAKRVVKKQVTAGGLRAVLNQTALEGTRFPRAAPLTRLLNFSRTFQGPEGAPCTPRTRVL